MPGLAFSVMRGGEKGVDEAGHRGIRIAEAFGLETFHVLRGRWQTVRSRAGAAGEGHGIGGGFGSSPFSRSFAR